MPSGLAGADIEGLLDEAEAVRSELEQDAEDNPGLRLGALLGAAAVAGVDKLVLADAGAAYAHLGDWVEQLVAESTGKDGKGILPVVVDGRDAPNFDPSTPDAVLVSYGPDDVAKEPASGWHAAVDGSLGAQMLLWEYATAVAGRVIGINPFDQPDVESAKAAAREMLEGGGTSPTPAFVDGPITVYASEGWLPEGCSSAAEAVTALLDGLDAGHGYVAVQAYLDRHRDAALADVRDGLATRTGRPVTFGWGPRFLHSTGQYHKGGPADRGLPAGHRAAGGRPGGARPAVHVPRVPDRPRPSATGGCWRRRAALCCGCTSAAQATWTPYDRPCCRERGQPAPGSRGPAAAADRGPCGMVLFGVTGDLSRKKVMPAIYDLANRGLLPPGFSLTGFARRDWANQDFEQIVHDSVKAHARTEFREEVWRQLAEGFRFVPGDFDDDAAFDHLRRTIEELDQDRGTGGNHAFYLAIPPGFFGDVVGQLKEHGLADPSEDSWRRVVVEKPFGHDLASARELNAMLDTVFPTGADVPDRPLPRQGDGPEHPGDPVRQHDVRADLERPLRRPRADHHGRGRRHRRPGRLLRRHRGRP